MRTLRCDNVLTAKLLRVCNSAEVGLRESVTSIDQAVMLLGDAAIFRTVCALGYGGGDERADGRLRGGSERALEPFGDDRGGGGVFGGE